MNQPPVLSGRATNGNLNRSISISGKVVMDDGSPVPQDIVIERVCSGTPHAVAYADSQGRFSFRWGAQDAGSPALTGRFGRGYRFQTYDRRRLRRIAIGGRVRTLWRRTAGQSHDELRVARGTGGVSLRHGENSQ